MLSRHLIMYLWTLGVRLGLVMKVSEHQSVFLSVGCTLESAWGLHKIWAWYHPYRFLFKFNPGFPVLIWLVVRLNIFRQLLISYNWHTLNCTISVYSLVSFDIWIYQWNHNHNQDSEHIHHPQTFFCAPFQFLPSLPPSSSIICH
jgi:hypothetical protein